MEKLALDYRKQVDKLFYRDQDKEGLYEHLRLYNDRISHVEELVSNMRSIISHPDQLTLFEDSKCLIRQEDQTTYGNVIPKYAPKRTRNVLLSASPKERIGFSVRGGVEHRIGFFVVGVEPASAAERCGVQVGDELLRVNGYSLISCTHREAVCLISRHKTMLSLKIRHIAMYPVPSGLDTNQCVHRWVFTDKNNTGGDVSQEGGKKVGQNGVLTSQNDDPASLYAVVNKQAKEDRRTVTVDWEGYSAIGFNIVDMKAGVFVSFVKPNTPAEIAGVEVGDEILEVNGVNFRQAEASEVALALNDSKKLKMLVRKVKEPRNRTVSSISMNFSDPDNKEKQKVGIDEKIEQLFESNLAKTAELIKKQGRRGSILDFDENLPPPPPEMMATDTEISPAASFVPMIESEKQDTQDVGTTIYTTAEVHAEVENRQNEYSQQSNDDTDESLSGVTFASSNNILLQDIKLNGPDSPKSISTSSSEASSKISNTPLLIKTSNENHSGGSTIQQKINERENRRHKLESELRERLKLERQKRLVQEKSLRISRLRQELKETEREEARLQKWLADSENAEEQHHHTVGFYTYNHPDTVLEEVPTQEFDLTTPSDMRHRNFRKYSMASVSEENKGLPPPPPFIDFTDQQNREKVRLERQIDGKKIVISELKERVKKQGISGVSDQAIAMDNKQTNGSSNQTKYWVNRQSFAASNPTGKNTSNEITYF
ncbi:uncharacterized protein LOC120328468 [Styela clava]